ncbi:MAG: polysaccharide deacetylase family protein [Pseudomonadota bacterium]
MATKLGRISAPNSARASRLAAATGACAAALALLAAPAVGAEQDTVATCTNPNALGVSRVIEVDTTGGIEYGQQQYKHQADPLRDGEVVLTFDDGPLRRNTRKVLRALAEHCTKAIFFAVGRMAVVDPKTLREVADAGHTIGHHTWSHKNQQSRSLPRAIAEMELGLSAIEAAIGRPSAPFFRFPYLAHTRQMRAYLGERNFGVFSIDIDSFDWRSKSASRVRKTIMRKLRAKRKGILLFHDIQSATANALGPLLNEIKAGGFRIVHMVPKHTAETLPEYNTVAGRLLDKRAYRHRARPLKTAFRFSGKVPAGGKKNKPAVQQVSATPDSVPGVERVRRTRASTTVEPRRPRPVRQKPRPKPAPILRKVPDWRTSVFSD